jgi:hypothetical protein
MTSAAFPRNRVRPKKFIQYKINVQFPHGFTHPLSNGCYFGNKTNKINFFSPHRYKSHTEKAVIRPAGFSFIGASNKMNPCLQWFILHRGNSVRFAS